ncbi:MAG: hypothetical protein ACE5G2_07950 [Candidatus Krumholzibacteriia bacterium]
MTRSPFLKCLSPKLIVMVLVACIGLMATSGLAFADPDNLGSLERRRGGGLRVPTENQPLTASAVIEDPRITIGPVPGRDRGGRFPNDWAPVGKTQPGPLTKAWMRLHRLVER